MHLSMFLSTEVAGGGRSGGLDSQKFPVLENLKEYFDTGWGLLIPLPEILEEIMCEF